MNKTYVEQFKRSLKIENSILGIFFSDKMPKKFNYYNNTACTALGRCFKNGDTVVFGHGKYRQLCPGADYFLKLSKILTKEAIDVYINQENVFRDKKTCSRFLSSLPKFPENLKRKYIIIKKLDIEDKPPIVIFLVNPAQVGRIIGLLNYKGYKSIKLFPSQPTCLSLFAPLATNFPHINFIDYYDRYYQGKINGKNIWSENKLIISLNYRDFKEVLSNFKKSPHGDFKPKLTPKKVDCFKI